MLLVHCYLLGLSALSLVISIDATPFVQTLGGGSGGGELITDPTVTRLDNTAFHYEYFQSPGTTYYPVSTWMSCRRAVKVGDYIFSLPFHAGFILKFTVSTNAWKQIPVTIQRGGDKTTAAAYDQNNHLWISPNFGFTRFMKLNIDTDSIIYYGGSGMPAGVPSINLNSYKYGRCVWDGANHMWFAPTPAYKYFIRIHRTSGALSGVTSYLVPAGASALVQANGFLFVGLSSLSKIAKFSVATATFLHDISRPVGYVGDFGGIHAFDGTFLYAGLNLGSGNTHLVKIDPDTDAMTFLPLSGATIVDGNTPIGLPWYDGGDYLITAHFRTSIITGVTEEILKSPTPVPPWWDTGNEEYINQFPDPRAPVVWKLPDRLGTLGTTGFIRATAYTPSLTISDSQLPTLTHHPLSATPLPTSTATESKTVGLCWQNSGRSADVIGTRFDAVPATDGIGTDIKIGSPDQIISDGQHFLYLAQKQCPGCVVRRVDVRTGYVTHILGAGADGADVPVGNGLSANIRPRGVVVVPKSGVFPPGAALFDLIVHTGENHRKLLSIDADPSGTFPSTHVAGSGAAGCGDDSSNGLLATTHWTEGMAFRSLDQKVYFAETTCSSIRTLDTSSSVMGVAAILGGAGPAGLQDGPANTALLDHPLTLALSPDEDSLYFTKDQTTPVIPIGGNLRRYIFSTNIVTTLNSLPVATSFAPVVQVDEATFSEIRLNGNFGFLNSGDSTLLLIPEPVTKQLKVMTTATSFVYSTVGWLKHHSPKQFSLDRCATIKKGDNVAFCVSSTENVVVMVSFKPDCGPTSSTTQSIRTNVATSSQVASKTDEAALVSKSRNMKNSMTVSEVTVTRTLNESTHTLLPSESLSLPETPSLELTLSAEETETLDLSLTETRLEPTKTLQPILLIEARLLEENETIAIALRRNPEELSSNNNNNNTTSERVQYIEVSLQSLNASSTGVELTLLPISHVTTAVIFRHAAVVVNGSGAGSHDEGNTNQQILRCPKTLRSELLCSIADGFLFLRNHNNSDTESTSRTGLYAYFEVRFPDYYRGDYKISIFGHGAEGASFETTLFVNQQDPGLGSPEVGRKSSSSPIQSLFVKQKCFDPLITSSIVVVALFVVMTVVKLLWMRRKSQEEGSSFDSTTKVKFCTYKGVSPWRSLLVNHRYLSVLSPCHVQCCLHHVILLASHLMMLLLFVTLVHDELALSDGPSKASPIHILTTTFLALIFTYPGAGTSGLFYWQFRLDRRGLLQKKKEKDAKRHATLLKLRSVVSQLQRERKGSDGGVDSNNTSRRSLLHRSSTSIGVDSSFRAANFMYSDIPDDLALAEECEEEQFELESKGGPPSDADSTTRSADNDKEPCLEDDVIKSDDQEENKVGEPSAQEGEVASSSSSGDPQLSWKNRTLAGTELDLGSIKSSFSHSDSESASQGGVTALLQQEEEEDDDEENSEEDKSPTVTQEAVLRGHVVNFLLFSASIIISAILLSRISSQEQCSVLMTTFQYSVLIDATLGQSLMLLCVYLYRWLYASGGGYLAKAIGRKGEEAETLDESGRSPIFAELHPFEGELRPS